MNPCNRPTFPGKYGRWIVQTNFTSNRYYSEKGLICLLVIRTKPVISLFSISLHCKKPHGYHNKIHHFEICHSSSMRSYILYMTVYIRKFSEEEISWSILSEWQLLEKGCELVMLSGCSPFLPPFNWRSWKFNVLRTIGILFSSDEKVSLLVSYGYVQDFE